MRIIIKNYELDWGKPIKEKIDSKIAIISVYK